MKTTAHSADRLDVAAFAKARAHVESGLPLDAMTRLWAGVQAPADVPVPVATWSADGLWSQPTGSPPEVRLRLRAQAQAWMTCQRCLQPLAVPLAVDRTFRFARDEDEAARLDEEEDQEDVLAMTRALDLPALVEDELILALPIVPRHETCPQPLPWRAETSTPPPGIEATSAAPAHPFAVLAKLKP